MDVDKLLVHKPAHRRDAEKWKAAKTHPADAAKLYEAELCHFAPFSLPFRGENGKMAKLCKEL